MFRNAFKLCCLRDKVRRNLNRNRNKQNVKFVNECRQGQRKLPSVCYRRITEGSVWVGMCFAASEVFKPRTLTKRCELIRDVRAEDSDMLGVLQRTKKLIEEGMIDVAEHLLSEALQKSKTKQLTEWTNVFLLLLGKISLRKKEYEKSEKLYDELVGNLHKTLAKNAAIHRLTLWAYIDLAQLYSETDRYEKAEQLYKQCLYDLEVMFVDAHDFQWAVETLQHVLDGYAHLLVNTARYKEALDQRETVHSLYKTLYGDKHQKLVYNLNEFGRIFTYLGDDDRAIKFFNEALEMSKHVEIDQLEVCALYVNLGRVHMRKGILKKAKEFCTEAMFIAKKLDNPIGKDQAGRCLDEISSYRP